MNIRRFSHSLTRRDLMKRLGAAALALPALELFGGESRALAAPGKSKFLVFLYQPNGVPSNVFWPTGTETNFQLSSVLMACTPFKDRMLILGPQLAGNMPVTGTGMTYLVPPPQHQAPVCLAARIGTGCTGHECTVTPGGHDGWGLPYNNQDTAVNPIDGPSIDQVIAMAVQGSSPFSSLNFGMHPVGGDTPSDINYAPDGTPLKRMASADEAWNRVFGMVMPGGGGNTAGVLQAQSDLRKQAALTNLLNSRFSSLRTQVSAYDRNVLDHHLASLRTFEDRRAQLLMGEMTQQMQCMQPMRTAVPADANSVRTGADSEQMSPFFMDMIATAFSCNLTKVASVTFGTPGGGGTGGMRMPWLGFTDPLHAVSHHGGNPVMLDKYRQMTTWIAGQVAGLVQRLAAVQLPGGAGTLLDQTTIYWFNRHGEGNVHANFAVPIIILGGTGGYFKMGRYLQLPATNPTKGLISIANAMGVNVPTFGQKEFADSAPLAGIAA